MIPKQTDHIIDEMVAIDKISSTDAYAKVQSKIRHNHRSKQTTRLRNALLATISTAAVIALLFMIGNKPIIINNDSEDIAMYTLPDGSILHLNTGATIEYSSRMRSKRDIYLSGEAFFSVKPDKTRPFTVYVANSKVTVLGTSFNVRTVQGTADIEVLVKTGKVNLSSQLNNVNLEVNDLGYITNGEAKSREWKDVNYLAWKDKKLSFSNDKLSYVVNTLSQCYNRPIELESNVSPSMMITTTFDQMSFEEVLTSICLTLDLSYSKDAETYVISLD